MFLCGVDVGAKSHRRLVLLSRDENGNLSNLVSRLCVQGKEPTMFEWGCFQQKPNPVWGPLGFDADYNRRTIVVKSLQSSYNRRTALNLH